MRVGVDEVLFQRSIVWKALLAFVTPCSHLCGLFGETFSGGGRRNSLFFASRRTLLSRQISCAYNQSLEFSGTL